MTDGNQRQFFAGKDFQTSFDELDKLPTVGRLTAFDISERLYRIGVLKTGPAASHLRTGLGAKDGLLRLAGLSGGILSTSNKLPNRVILSCPDRDKGLTAFDLETLLCCCRKAEIEEDAEGFLEGTLSPTDFAKLYAKWYGQPHGCMPR
jgi:hypothetical protein